MSCNTNLRAADILRRHGLRPRHSLGQNFLDDPSALRQVVEAAQILPHDVVLEIGTGIGSLTRQLAISAKRVVGIEVDAALASICRQELQHHSNVDVVLGDVLELDPGARGLPLGYLVVANIPYYITSPILKHLLESQPRPRRIVLTVQKEVAERISAQPPAMSLLAVSVQIHGATRVVGKIPASAFHPKPKVDSAILRIDCFDRAKVDPEKLADFFRTVKGGFLQPRKMLRNSIAAAFRTPASDIDVLMLAAGLDGRRRAETLSLEEWMRLADCVAAKAA